MRTNREHAVTGRIHGSLFRLRDGQEIAIYLRDGVPSVAEFRQGLGELRSASEWMSVNGRKLVHAERRGALETVSPIPAAMARRIEVLHLSPVRPRQNSVTRRLADLASRLAEQCAELRRRSFGRGSFSSGDSAA
jgi:hypothetical protein